MNYEILQNQIEKHSKNPQNIQVAASFSVSVILLMARSFAKAKGEIVKTIFFIVIQTKLI